jgi:hypothetical protein
MTIAEIGRAIAQAIGGRPQASKVLGIAERLVEHGRYREAIDLATAANRRLGNVLIEQRVVVWRCAGYPGEAESVSRPDWPPAIEDPFQRAAPGAAEISGSAALTPELLGGGILHHGCLIVRGLLSYREAETLREGIDKAIAACRQTRSGGASARTKRWYSPIPIETGSTNHVNRYVAEELEGNVLTVDSPRMLFELIELFYKRGIVRAITGYLGERPAVSVGKSILRRVVPQTEPGDWHQDGAFLGSAVRTVNCWLALSHCGGDAPGLDMVPRRLSALAPTGTKGAHFDWSVAPDVADEAAGGLSTASPIFAPGDAVFFDGLFLHRTPGSPAHIKPRYAIETWFFAPSTFPEGWGPILF